MTFEVALAALGARARPSRGAIKRLPLLISLGLGLLSAHCSSQADERGVTTGADAHGESIVRMHLMGALSATLRPCNCRPGMLGGLDHAAAALRAAPDARATPPPALLLAAGSTLFDSPTLAPRKRAQALLKARVIAASLAEMGLAAWTPGVADFAAGVASFGELAALARAPAVAANVELSSGVIDRSRILERAGLKIGVTGLLLATDDTALPPGVHIRDPVASARQARAELATQNPDINVLLVSGPRGAALHIVRELPGFDLAVIGSEDSEVLAVDAEPTTKIERTLVVAPADRLQALELVDVVRKSGRVQLERRAAVQVTQALGTDADIAARMRRYDAEVDARNRSADVQPAAAEPGRPRYVGAERCGECHDAAFVFWNNTRHARAYWTLLNANKTHDLDCIGCHVTGYDQPGGSAGTQARGLEAVQCEACHGPGSTHAQNGARDAIVKTPERSLCRTCHHPPHVESAWNLTTAWKKTIGPGHGQSRAR